MDIKKLRKDLLVSQVEFAGMVGVSYEAVKKWEQKNFMPSTRNLNKINAVCKQYGLDINNYIIK